MSLQEPGPDHLPTSGGAPETPDDRGRNERASDVNGAQRANGKYRLASSKASASGTIGEHKPEPKIEALSKMADDTEAEAQADQADIIESENDLAMRRVEDEMFFLPSDAERCRSFCAGALKYVFPRVEGGLMDFGYAQSGLENKAAARNNFGFSKTEMYRIVDQLLAGKMPKQLKRLKEGTSVLKFVRPPLTVEEWLSRDLPEPDFMLGSWLAKHSRVMVWAPTGLGKTNLMMQLAYNVSLGKPFLHWQGRRVCKVLYIDGEMSRRLFRRRIRECSERAGETSTTFFALSSEDVENFGPLNTPAGQAYIEKLIGELGGVDLIVFDSIMCLLLGDMKEAEPWAQGLPWIKSLTKRNIGQIWVHHTGHDESKAYGDKTKEWQLDSVIALERAEHELTKVCFAVEFKKARERTPETMADFGRVKVALVDDQWTVEGAVAAKPPGKTSPKGQSFLRALNNVLAGDIGVRVIEGRRATDVETWAVECTKLGLIDPKTKPKSARTQMAAYRRELVSAHRVACDGDWTWTL